MAENGARQTRMIVPGDAEWPSGLEVMGADQPDRLFIRGDASLAGRTEYSVAVAGSTIRRVVPSGVPSPSIPTIIRAWIAKLADGSSSVVAHRGP